MPGERSVSILSGASLSQAYNIGGVQLAGVVIPSAWTAASITFQFSAEGTVFSDVYDSLGNEITILSANIPTATSRYIDFTSASWSPAWFIPGYFKVRSGTTATPVNQAADRTLRFVTVP